MKQGKVRTRSNKAARTMAIEGLESRTLLAATKIMPLGDSITEGWNGFTSYRFALYQQLVMAGYDIDFVGNRTGIASGLTPRYSNFDQNHQGTAGWRADQIQANIASYATQNPPEVVLLHIGTNDITQGQSNSSTITEIGGIIDNLRTIVPSVKILLAKIIPGATNTSTYANLNTLIDTLAGQKNTAQSPVILVDQFTGFSTTADVFDGLHPDDSGERKMAAKWFTALQGILPTPTPPAPVTYVSDLTPTQSTNGLGPVEKDLSNGEGGTGDGRIIGLNTIGHLKGLGVHAASDVRYNLVGGNYTEFRADIGVDDEVGTNGRVVFQGYVDNVLQYTSPQMNGNTATQSVVVNVTGASTLRLVVTDSGNGTTSDHADWASARLISGPVIPVPSAPSGLDATLNGSQVNLVWTDNANNETGYRVQRKTGAAGTWAQLGSDLAANATGFVDSTGATGNTYFYRVLAFNAGGPSNFSNEDSVTIPLPPGTTYLSDLNPTSSSNGWGPFERDRSNGETGATDGNPITLNGVVYPKGLGVHAASQIIYALNGLYTQFNSDIGVDDETGANGSVVFQVFLDASNTPIYQSPTMTGNTTTITIPTINVVGVQSLRLVVTEAGDGGAYDHGDWANARLIAGQFPATPTGLTAGVVGQQINLAWTDNANNETGYRVERKTGAAGAWGTLINLSAGAINHSDTTATPGQQYFFRVIALGSSGNSVPSNEADATIPVPAPTAPTGLDALVSGQQINLTWTDNANNENGYRVQRKTGAAGTWAQLGSDLGANSVGYSDTTATAGVEYYYRVLAFNSGGPSGFSNEDNATVPLPPAPNAPSGLGATLVGAQINLAWTDAANNEIGFRVDRKTGIGGTYGQIADLGANTTSYSDTTSLQPGTTYYYRVYAYNGGGNSGFSNEAFATTLATVYVSDLPYVVVGNGWGLPEKDRSNGETGSADGTTIRLNGVAYTKGIGVHATADVNVNLGGQYSTFLSDIGMDDEVGNNGSVVFQVYLDGVIAYDSGVMNGTTATKQINLNVLGKTTMRLLVTDAGNGNAYDHADWADARLILGTPVPPPSQPTGLGATLNGVNVDLSWTDVATDETSYRVQRKLGVGGTWGNVQTLGVNATSWTDTGPLNPNTTYYYRVFAVNGGGDSTPSNEANVTTAPIPVPTAPTGLGATYNTGTSRVDLTWTDTAGNETGFRIERKLGAGGTWATVTTVGANILSYSDSGPFQSNSNYFYRVYAFNLGGDSASASNEANATTPAAPVQTWLSDLNWVSATNGWGSVEKDRSNGEIGATDGGTITLNGATYAKGLGVHANSSIVYNLNGQYQSFQSDIGLDDEVGNNGSVVFQVFVDNVNVFSSTVMNGSSATQSVNLNVAGAATLRLVVINANDGFDFDHGDWAGARLLS